MFGSPGMRTNWNLFWVCFLVMILVSSALTGSVLAEDQGSGNGTQVASFENGTMTADGAIDFSASPLDGYAPLCVTFTVHGQPGDYLWDFGDGTTSNSQNPVHCYQNVGSYWVKLQYSAGQNMGEVSKVDYIRVKDPVTRVDYDATPLNGTVPLTVQFSIIGNPTTLHWDFDDGQESSEKNPVHQYQQSGYYSPILTYCADSACDKISKYNYIEVSSGEEVNFTAEDLGGVAPLSTKFIANGQADTYAWDFGDGTTSYEQDPGHYYTQPGNYTVTLTYSIDGAAYSVTRSDYIHVTSRYAPDFNASPRSGMAPLCVEMDMTTQPQSWLWMFGDDVTSPDAHGSHCYGVGGRYDLGLHYCYNGYCSDVVKPGYITVMSPRI